MPEATSLNIGSSPLAALSGARSADGSAGVAAQAEDGNPNGFQAMLAAQLDQGVEQSAGPGIMPGLTQGIAQTIGQSPPQPFAAAPRQLPVVTTMTALRNTAAAITGASITGAAITGAVAPITDAATEATTDAPADAPADAAILAPNGNLPVGGKILPVGVSLKDGAPKDDADPAPDTPPRTMAAPELTKPATPKAMVLAPRLRKGSEEQSDPTTAQADKDTGLADADVDAATVTPSTTPPATPNAAPETMAPAALALAGGASAIMMTIHPAAPSAPGVSDAAPGVADTATRPTASRLSGGAQARPANAAPLDPATMSAQDAAAGQGPVQAPVQAPAQAQTPSANPLWPAGLPQWLGAQQGDVTVKDSVAQTAPALGKTIVKVNRMNAGADLTAPSANVPSDPAPQSAEPLSTGQPSAAPLHQTAHAVMPDAPPSTADTLASPLAGSQSTSDIAPRPAMPATVETGATRDMSALVDRLVEARAAMRSGASTQWVQTSIQHAEFGRVALQIRQDGDHLSVAMASNDPDFAPAAQAALHAQGLLQPAAASQSGADAGQNTGQGAGQGAGQDNRQSGQGNNSPAFNGQSGSQFSGQFGGQLGGQASGQNHQPPTRQQAPFAADNQPATQQGPASGETGSRTLSGRTLSGRSGILA